MRVLPILLVLLAVAGGVRRVPGRAIGDPGYEWIFSEYLSDGAGGFTGPFELDSGEQLGGLLDERFTLAPTGTDHLRVLRDRGRRRVLGERPRRRSPPRRTRGPASAAARSSPSPRSSRKDLADATLQFIIENSLLNVRDFRFDPARGLRAIVPTGSKRARSSASTRRPSSTVTAGDWTFDENGTGVLPYEIVNGALDERASSSRSASRSSRRST